MEKMKAWKVIDRLSPIPKWVIQFQSRAGGWRNEFFSSTAEAVDEINDEFGISQGAPEIKVGKGNAILGIKPLDGFAHIDWVLVEPPPEKALRELQVALSKRYTEATAEIRAVRDV